MDERHNENIEKSSAHENNEDGHRELMERANLMRGHIYFENTWEDRY